MKPLYAIMVLLAAFSGVLLYRMLSPRPPVPPTRLPETPEPRPSSDGSGTRVQPHPFLRTVLEVTDARGRRHALLTRSSQYGLYYRCEGGEPIQLDMGVRVGEGMDLAVTDGGGVFAAYVDARTGEVRFAAPDRTPRPWIGLRRLRRPRRCTLTADRAGVLVSYYDEETEELCYSYLSHTDHSWRHGVASRGGHYRVVTGRPGAFVVSR